MDGFKTKEARSYENRRSVADERQARKGAVGWIQELQRDRMNEITFQIKQSDDLENAYRMNKGAERQQAQNLLLIYSLDSSRSRACTRTY